MYPTSIFFGRDLLLSAKLVFVTSWSLSTQVYTRIVEILKFVSTRHDINSLSFLDDEKLECRFY
jgi:hypothetical protein